MPRRAPGSLWDWTIGVWAPTLPLPVWVQSGCSSGARRAAGKESDLALHGPRRSQAGAWKAPQLRRPKMRKLSEHDDDCVPGE